MHRRQRSAVIKCLVHSSEIKNIKIKTKKPCLVLSRSVSHVDHSFVYLVATSQCYSSFSPTSKKCQYKRILWQNHHLARFTLYTQNPLHSNRIQFKQKKNTKHRKPTHSIQNYPKQQQRAVSLFSSSVSSRFPFLLFSCFVYACSTAYGVCMCDYPLCTMCFLRFDGCGNASITAFIRLYLL